MSEDIQATPELTPEQEVAQMQERLNKAKAKQAEAETLRLGALRAKVAAINAAREKKEADERAEAERITNMHLERRRKAQEEEAVKQREEARVAAELQQQIAAQEEVINKQRQHEAELAKISAEIAAAEATADAAILAAKNDLEFVEAGVATQEVQPDANDDTLQGDRHPLRRFQRRDNIFSPDIPVTDTQEVSSEMQSRHQAALDSVINSAEFGTRPTYAQPAPDPAPVAVVEPIRKSNRYADTTVSLQLEKLLKTDLGMSVGPMKLDALSAEWTETFLLRVAHAVIAQAKVTPMSADGVLFNIQAQLEEMASNA